MTISSRVKAVAGGIVRLLGQRKVYRWRRTGMYATKADYDRTHGRDVTVDTIWRFSGKLV